MNTSEGSDFNLLELACFTRPLKQIATTPVVPTIGIAPAMFWAVKLDRDDILRSLLRCDFSTDETDDQGRTPLQLSIELGHSQCTSLLRSSEMNRPF